MAKLKKFKKFKVKKYLIPGELDVDKDGNAVAKDSDEIVDELCALLDHACSWDIVGPALIQDAKGNHYKVCVEAYLVKVDKAEANEMLENEDLAHECD